MVRYLKIIVVLLLASSSTLVRGEDKDYYYGLKVGILNIDVNGYSEKILHTFEYKDTSLIGATAGYRFDENLLIEADIATTVKDGDINDTTIAKTIDRWGATMIGVHGAFQSRGKFHFKIKAGLTNVNFDDSSIFNDNVAVPESNATDFSYGVSFGINTSSGKEFVVEWAQISEELSSLTFGINF